MSLDSLDQRFGEMLKNRAGKMYRRPKRLKPIQKKLQPIGTSVTPVALQEPKQVAAAVTFPQVSYRKLPACSEGCAGCQQGHHCGNKRCGCGY